MKKVLIIRFSSIGDIVLTTPVIRCLKKQLPECELHYLTKPAYVSILQANPYLHQVHVLDKPILNKAMDLKKLDFDLIIDLHSNLRTRIIKGILDCPSSSFDKLNFEKWWLVNTKINLLPHKHIVDRYMETVKRVGVINDGDGLDYFIPPSTVLNESLPDTFIAFVIGAQHATKRLPDEHIIEICKRISMPVILLGGKEDETRGQSIQLSSGNHVINTCGKLSLHQSALVVQGADKVITHDTGLMHIAAALKKEIISVWGNTVPEFGMYPYYGNGQVRNSIIEVKHLPCRPCTKIGFNACPQKHFKCMRNQDVERIITDVRLQM